MMVSINLRLKVIKENTRESDMIANMEKKKKKKKHPNHSKGKKVFLKNGKIITNNRDSNVK
jgi:hypothetical protein